jgi:hypothetical protein
MRLRIGRLRQVVKQDLPIEFTDERLTSYGGLELLRRYFHLIQLHQRIRHAFRAHRLGGDYGCVRLVLLVIGLLLVGGRRLRQLRYVGSDPLFVRLCGLARIPSDRTVVNWLKQFTQASLCALVRINSELLYDQMREMDVRRLDIDIDGTVISTGSKVAWAMHGYNPHHPKDLSYYPLLAHWAQTGQILRLKNRPGNVQDNKGAEGFLREMIDELRGRLGRSLILQFRMDAAFFRENLLKLFLRRRCFYAVKVPFCQWTGVKALITAQRDWSAVVPQVSCFESRLKLKFWELELRVVVYRKRVHHKSHRNYQLDLFDPNDGYFEYSAVATNLEMSPRSLWHLMAGRGAQEKTFAELKGEFALDAVPTNHYGANTAWMQLSILAYNLMRKFQIDTQLAPARPASRKRTYAFVLSSMKTMRFTFLNRAARVVNISGYRRLRFSFNPATQNLYNKVNQRLVA